jgi:hypothetical protein
VTGSVARGRRGSKRRVLGGAVLCGVLAACGSSGPPSAARSPHVPGPAGLDWSTALEVERPEGMEAEPPSIPPVGSGGGLGHPGHFAGQGNPYDLVALGDTLVAVGYTFPGFHAVTWSSTDREHWTLAELPGGTDAAFALSIATGAAGGPGAGRSTIVGRIGNDAAAWSSSDGATWAQARGGPAFVEAPETRMTTVVAGSTGFVAGGWAGIVNQGGHARFWTSPDGATWKRAAVEPGSDDGRVAAIAAGPGGFVAVGATGAVGHATGAAVWRSADGATWERAQVGASGSSGAMTSVTAGGPGWVAVGSALDGTRAMVWLSADGRSWSAAADQDSLAYHGLGIAMADVSAAPGGRLVVVGHFLFGQQYGQGTAWTSDDSGATWTRMPDQAAFGQGEPQAVVPDGAGFVAVGTVGAPDNYIPTVWLSPSRR